MVALLVVAGLGGRWAWNNYNDPIRNAVWVWNPSDGMTTYGPPLAFGEDALVAVEYNHSKATLVVLDAASGVELSRYDFTDAGFGDIDNAGVVHSDANGTVAYAHDGTRDISRVVSISSDGALGVVSDAVKGFVWDADVSAETTILLVATSSDRTDADEEVIAFRDGSEVWRHNAFSGFVSSLCTVTPDIVAVFHPAAPRPLLRADSVCPQFGEGNSERRFLSISDGSERELVSPAAGTPTHVYGLGYLVDQGRWFTYVDTRGNNIWEGPAELNGAPYGVIDDMILVDGIGNGTALDAPRRIDAQTGAVAWEVAPYILALSGNNDWDGASWLGIVEDGLVLKAGCSLTLIDPEDGRSVASALIGADGFCSNIELLGSGASEEHGSLVYVEDGFDILSVNLLEGKVISRFEVARGWCNVTAGTFACTLGDGRIVAFVNGISISA